MIQIDISPEGGYLIQTADQTQTVPTFVDLMHAMLTEFKAGATPVTNNTQHTGAWHMRALEELVGDLNEYNLKPHQIVNILGKLQTTITNNLPADALKPKSKQLQLIDAGFVVEGAIPALEEAPPFDMTHILPERLGNIYEFDYNGRIALSAKGRRDSPLFIKKQVLPQLKSLTRKSLENATSILGDNKGRMLAEYIEILKDRDMGIYPILHTNTHITDDGGELIAEDLEAGGGTAGEEAGYNYMSD